MNFWRRYRERLEQAAQVRVIHHATVTRLDRDPVGGAVERAVVAGGPERRFEVEARAFVVAAGGLESARLLLASNEQTPAGIGNEHDLVGRFYMTHPVAEVGRVDLADPATAADAGGFLLTRDAVYCRRMLRLQRRCSARAPPAQPRAGALVSRARRPDPLRRPAVHLRPRPGRDGARARGLEVHGHPPPLRRDRGRARARGERGARPPAVGSYGAMWARRRWLSKRTLPSFMTSPESGLMRLRFDAEQSPEAENRVTLSRERDAYGVPRLSLAYRVSASDRERIARGLTIVGIELDRLGAATVELPPEEEALAELKLGDGTHQLGLTRMAASPGPGGRGRATAACTARGTSWWRAAPCSPPPAPWAPP